MINIYGHVSNWGALFSSLKYNICGVKNHPKKLPLAGVFLLGQTGHLILRHTHIYIILLYNPHHVYLCISKTKTRNLQVQNLRQLPCWCCHRSTGATIPMGDLHILHPNSLYDQLACTKRAAGTVGYHQWWTTGCTRPACFQGQRVKDKTEWRNIAFSHGRSLGLTRASLFVSCHNLENLQDFLSCSIYHPKISKKLFGYQGFSELLNLSSKNLIWLSGMSRNAIKSLRFWVKMFWQPLNYKLPAGI